MYENIHCNIALQYLASHFKLMSIFRMLAKTSKNITCNKNVQCHDKYIYCLKNCTQHTVQDFIFCTSILNFHNLKASIDKRH